MVEEDLANVKLDKDFKVEWAALITAFAGTTYQPYAVQEYSDGSAIAVIGLDKTKKMPVQPYSYGKLDSIQPKVRYRQGPKFLRILIGYMVLEDTIPC